MSMDPNGIEATALAEYEDHAARALGVPVPDEAARALCGVLLDHDENDDGDVSFGDARASVPSVATPVVVAELLALAEKVAALRDHGSERYRDGFDAAIGAVREMIADRCDELGTRVEEL